MSASFTNAYALLAGVHENSVAEWALPEVIKDVQALEAVLLHPGRCAYAPENVQTLTGKDATRDGILDGLQWLKERLAAAADATALIYYSGHGWRDTSSGSPEYFLVPHDAVRGRLRYTALRATDFAGEIDSLHPARLLVILDCCHAGGMSVKDLAPDGPRPAAFPAGLLGVPEQSLLPADGAKGLEGLGQGHGRAVLSSSQGEQRSYIRRDQAMSIFTYHLVEALTGHAQPQAGATEVLVSDVMSHVYRCVPASAQAEWGQVQQPDYRVSGNFPVARLLGGKGLEQGVRPPDPLAGLPPVSISTGGAPYFGSFNGTYVGRDQHVRYEDRHVEVNAPLSGSVVNTGDNNKIRVSNTTVPEGFFELLQQLQAEIRQAPLPAEAQAELIEDLAEVEAQAAQPAPNRGRILKLLAGIAALVADSSTILVSAPQLVDLARQALDWAGKLF